MNFITYVVLNVFGDSSVQECMYRYTALCVHKTLYPRMGPDDDYRLWCSKHIVLHLIVVVVTPHSLPKGAEVIRKASNTIPNALYGTLYMYTLPDAV